MYVQSSLQNPYTRTHQGFYEDTTPVVSVAGIQLFPGI